MTSLRTANPDDAEAISAIYIPIVRDTPISFEIDPPTVEVMRTRLETTLRRYPWLVSLDEAGTVNGYVYATQHRERAAYRWAVDTTVYIRADSHGQGLGRRLYTALFEELVTLGYVHACAGITLPNAGSVGLHEAVGFSLVGVYREVGFKMGRWRDVGWWQKTLQQPSEPVEPRAFSSGR